MARVFTGKVVIPGDKIDEYFQAVQQAEAARAPFREFLEQAIFALGTNAK